MRIRHHVNPFQIGFQRSLAEPVALPTDCEVEVEIGCADAQFLFERAALDETRLELGIELRNEIVEWVNDKAARDGVRVRALFANANIGLCDLLGEGTVRRFFVNFPDPWFKRRQQKRRVVDADLVASMHRALRPDGELFFQSDVWDLSLAAMDVIERAPGFENTLGEWTFVKGLNPFGARSKRESWCEAHNERVWRMLYHRV